MAAGGALPATDTLAKCETPALSVENQPTDSDPSVRPAQKLDTALEHDVFWPRSRLAPLKFWAAKAATSIILMELVKPSLTAHVVTEPPVFGGFEKLSM
jgi:hypothetical protein